MLPSSWMAMDVGQKKNGKPRVLGHKQGVVTVREITQVAAELGIKYLTLYAFSTENWNRPRFEINALMQLLVDTLNKEIETLNNNRIQLRAIGDLEKLPTSTLKALKEGIRKTENNERMTLILALNYSSKWEILQAVKTIAGQVKTKQLNETDINEEVFTKVLSTSGIPDPELLIRTSGEIRISNFLLWQIAYSELYFSPVYWPEFTKDHLYEAIIEFPITRKAIWKNFRAIDLIPTQRCNYKC